MKFHFSVEFICLFCLCMRETSYVCARENNQTLKIIWIYCELRLVFFWIATRWHNVFSFPFNRASVGGSNMQQLYFILFFQQIFVGLTHIHWCSEARSREKDSETQNWMTICDDFVGMLFLRANRTNWIILHIYVYDDRPIPLRVSKRFIFCLADTEIKLQLCEWNKTNKKFKSKNVEDLLA